MEGGGSGGAAIGPQLPHAAGQRLLPVLVGAPAVGLCTRPCGKERTPVAVAVTHLTTPLAEFSSSAFT